MILLLIGITAIAGVAIGWVGHKASARIAQWGARMNEVDEIFRTASEGEDQISAPALRARPADAPRTQSPFAGQHLPTGHASR